MLKGILWHQGEADFKDPDYLNKLVKLVIGINNGSLINQQIAKLPTKLGGTAFVSSKRLTAMDRWHFDNQSMQKLGEGYAKAMLKLQKMD